MQKITFKTSRFTRIIYPLIVLFCVFALIYFVVMGKSVISLFSFLPLSILLYYQAYQKYVLQDNAFVIKNGLGGVSNNIPWTDMIRISLDRKNIRIDYSKSNGMNGFLVLRDVENKDLLYKSLENAFSEKRVAV